MTRDEFAQAQKMLHEESGISLVGDAGQIETKGVKASYVYTGDELHVMVTKTPWLVTRNYAEEQIASALQKHGYPADVVG